jgi:hypothetical protein
MPQTMAVVHSIGTTASLNRDPSARPSRSFEDFFIAQNLPSSQHVDVLKFKEMCKVRGTAFRIERMPFTCVSLYLLFPSCLFGSTAGIASTSATPNSFLHGLHRRHSLY